MGLGSFLATVRSRRQALRQRFDVVRQFEQLEESCVPSYVHANLIAAGIAWGRLGLAATLWRRYAKPGPVLDFGAASGEIYHFLGLTPEYHFIEADPILDRALQDEIPTAIKENGVAAGHYSAIFALDSLEHNDDHATLLTQLAAGLNPDGVLILSGPTESWFYRLGRSIAGFSGHYHKTTIYDIQRTAATMLDQVASCTLPLPGLSLFHVSVWRSRRG